MHRRAEECIGLPESGFDKLKAFIYKKNKIWKPLMIYPLFMEEEARKYY